MHCILKTTALSLLCTIWLNTGVTAEMQGQAPNLNDIRIIPVDPTPEPYHVRTTIEFPEEGSIQHSTPVSGQVRLEGYSLGTDSEFPRRKEIWNDPKGQGVHIFIDNQPYFEVNEALIDALDDVQEYHDETSNFDLPVKLGKGVHVMRVFPVRSFNESLKGDKCFDARKFYYLEKVDNPNIDLAQPYLTFNEPQGEYDYGPQPLLLDFYLTNCQLSKDGYKVRITIDEASQRILTAWTPYYIYGLKKGAHKIRLELLDRQNAPVQMNKMFNDVTKTLILQ